MSVALTRDFLTRTTKTSQFYCDSSKADDSGDGLSWATAKKTWGGLNNVVPDVISHNTCVNLKGTFSDYSTYSFLPRHIIGNNTLLIDGGDDVTELVASTSSTAGSSSQVTGGSGFTDDQYTGYWLEIISGANNTSGQKRMIQRHVGNVFEPVKYFYDLTNHTPANPHPCTFRILRPTTTLSAPSVSSQFTLQQTGTGYVSLQRVYMTGTNRILINVTNAPLITLQGIIHTGNNGNTPIHVNPGPYIMLRPDITDPSTFATLSTELVQLGVAFTDTGSSVYGSFYNCDVDVRGSYFGNDARFYAVELQAFRYGSRAKRILMYDTNGKVNAGIRGDANFAATRILGGTDRGIGMYSSTLSITASATGGVDIRGNIGIQLHDGSDLWITGPVGSQNCTTYGLKMEQGNVVTVDGTGGNPTLARSDGLNQVVNKLLATSLWSTITGGTPLTDATNLTVATKV